jgi:hypothetical protein
MTVIARHTRIEVIPLAPVSTVTNRSMRMSASAGRTQGGVVLWHRHRQAHRLKGRPGGLIVKADVIDR